MEKISVLSDYELAEMGRAARKERDLLLKRRPELMEFQKEINRIMILAGNFKNRMAVLAIMMEGKLIELREQFSKLSILIRRRHVYTHQLPNPHLCSHRESRIEVSP